MSDGGFEVNHHPDAAPVFLGVYGDPVVGRALVLLLRGFGYQARCVPTYSLEEPGMLDGVRLWLLTPELGANQRESLLASLQDRLDARKTTILELTAVFNEAQEEVKDEIQRRIVPWPCSTKELERRIEAALSVRPESPAR